MVSRKQPAKLSLICCMLLFSVFAVHAQQVSDEHFNYPITSPRYPAGDGSLIVFDEGHNNPATMRGTYAAFNALLRSDGYQLLGSEHPVSSELLKNARIYVTVNAMHDPENWNLPTGSAFSGPESETIKRWVEAGGSLFLVTDHMPCGGSVNDLAGQFGINIVNGFALRKDRRPELFSKSRNTLSFNEITDGVDSIMCWGGTGFIVPPDAQVISMLGEDYDVYLPRDASHVPETVPRISGRGLANGASLKFGKGRVVIFGDGAMFTAQLQGVKSEKRGMNHPAAGQNARLLLNIIHWLDGNP